MLNFKSNIKNRAGIWLFTLGSFLFTLSSGNPTPSDEPVSKLKVENPYFLDLDTLRPLRERRDFQELMYMEKKDPSIIWIAFSTKNRSYDYCSAIAGVVAAELHRRIDKNAVVPPTKFVVKKSKNGHYILLGYVYQEIPFAKPILEALKQSEFDNYANHTIYKDHNIEQSMSQWMLLGLSPSPSSLRLAVSKNSRLIRYDYNRAFRYNNQNIDAECFCTSDFPINGYRCDVEYINNLKYEQYGQYRAILETVITDIRTAASQYLVEDEQQTFNRALEDILMKFQH